MYVFLFTIFLLLEKKINPKLSIIYMMWYFKGVAKIAFQTALTLL